MSNDTDYKLVFQTYSLELMEEVVSYLQTKKSRWDEAQSAGRSAEDLVAELGLESIGQVVSWGFDLGEIQPIGRRFRVKATA